MSKRGLFACFAGSLLVAIACGGAGSSGFNHKDGGGGNAGSGGSSGTGIQLGDSGASSTDSGPCTGIACNVEKCGSGTQTTVSGYVYAPNGQLPLYDVQVFIPNTALSALPKGVQCENCGAPLSGAPITTALSDATGYFELVGVPTGPNVPIVVQLGKWRREATIPMVTGCSANPLTDPNLTRLPKNQIEGNMPHIALTTGGCDQMGCMLTKLGIDPAEFGSQPDGYNKAINVYAGENPLGATLDPTWTPAMNLWGDATNLATYDEAIFSCECSEAPTSKGGVGAPAYGVVTDYLNAGGRIFTTDFQYVWYKFSPDPNIGGTGSPTIGLGQIMGGAPGGGSPMTLSTSIPKAVSLAAWLKNIFSGAPLPSGATFPLDPSSQVGEVTPDYVFSNIQSLDATKTITWATSPTPDGPRIFTVDTPVGTAPDKQCGRGVHIDAHVDQPPTQEVQLGYPTTGCGVPLKADEAAFAFFFFDLSSCISDEHVPPPPPPPVK